MRLRTCDPPPDVAIGRTAVYQVRGSHPLRSPFELAQDRRTQWEKSDFTISFLDGVEAQRKIIRDVIQGPFCWSAFCGVTFQFVEARDADIRITFTPGGSWSQLGKSSTNGDANTPSMQLGWVDESLDFWEAQRVTIHELGHALGFIHEHQSPAALIPWNEPAVMAHYMEAGWSEDQVLANVLTGWDASDCTNYSHYDPTSVMAYWLHMDWVLDPAFAHAPNNVPSSTDKAYAAQWWGPPVKRWYALHLPLVRR